MKKKKKKEKHNIKSEEKERVLPPELSSVLDLDAGKIAGVVACVLQEILWNRFNLPGRQLNS